MRRMASVERTAYPRFKRTISSRELHESFTPGPSEVEWARGKARSAEHLLALVVLLKSFQKLGYFPDLDQVPELVVGHVRGLLGLEEDVSPRHDSTRTAARQRDFIRERLGVVSKTGANVDREGLTTLLDLVQPGDSITVPTLDRLGRNITDVLVMVRDLTEQGVRLRSLHDPIPIDTADTSVMAQISMKLLALFADMERIFMLERVAGAREAKKKRGKRAGPKPKITPQQRKAIRTLMDDEDRDVTADQVAADFGISRATLYRELARAVTDNASKGPSV